MSDPFAIAPMQLLSRITKITIKEPKEGGDDATIQIVLEADWTSVADRLNRRVGRPLLLTLEEVQPQLPTLEDSTVTRTPNGRAR